MPKSERRLLRPKGCDGGGPPPPLHPSVVHFRPMMPVSLLWAVLASVGCTITDGWRRRKTALAASGDRRGAIIPPRAPTSTPGRGDASIGRDRRAPASPRWVCRKRGRQLSATAGLVRAGGELFFSANILPATNRSVYFRPSAIMRDLIHT